MSNREPVHSEAAANVETPRFLTPVEVARLFRVSKMTVYRAIRDGDLPAIPMRGRWAIPACAIDSMERLALGHVSTEDHAAIGETAGGTGTRLKGATESVYRRPRQRQRGGQIGISGDRQRHRGGVA
jgi:excisionase family DNA binding protein